MSDVPTTSPEPAVADSPPLRLVRGRATPEERGAVGAVRAGGGGGPVSPPPPPAPVSAWTDRGRLVRAPVSAGPAGWRASAFPR